MGNKWWVMLSKVTSNNRVVGPRTQNFVPMIKNHLLFPKLYGRAVNFFFPSVWSSSHVFVSHLFLITGSSTAKALRMLKLMNVACISERTFYRHTRFYVNPVVIQEWRNHQQQLLDDLAEREGGSAGGSWR